MKSLIRKWGNSAAVRIPAAVMVAAKLRVDQAVDVREEDGRLVIELIRAELPDLDVLLAAITPENLHTSVDCGPPVG